MAFNHQVPRLYRTVVDDVISNVRESFLDDGVDDQVLMELKQLWETKLHASKAVEPLSEVPPDRPAVVQRTVQQQGVGIRQPMMQGGQVPVFAQIPGMSRAATQATIALPAMYGQQVIQTDQGAIILQQAPGGQLVHGQVSGGQVRLIQPGTNQIGTAGNVVQLDGSSDVSTDCAASEPGCSGLSKRKPRKKLVKKEVKVDQCDGQGDSSSEDDEDDDDDDKDEDDEREEEEEGVEEAPLNSEDDVSDEDPSELFDTDNVIVCQYDKINRCKNKWKFHLKDGIMNLSGRDYVFQRAAGDAEW